MSVFDGWAHQLGLAQQAHEAQGRHGAEVNLLSSLWGTRSQCSAAADGWASCPLNQNALLRILGNPRYSNSPGGPDALSSDAAGVFVAEALLHHGQITNTYLTCARCASPRKDCQL